MMNVDALKDELKIKTIKFIFKNYITRPQDTDLKYKYKTMAVELSLKKLSVIEIDNLKKCVDEAVSFWISPEIEDCQNIEDEERKKKRLAEIDKFINYLTVNTLYQLVVEKEEYVYIHKSWDAMENLVESVIDSRIPELYMPVKTHMHVYRDKIMVNGELYYDSTQNDVENSDSMNLGRNKVRTKNFNEYFNLFSNNK